MIPPPGWAEDPHSHRFRTGVANLANPGTGRLQNNCSSAILVRTPQGQDRLYTMHPEVRVFVPGTK